MKTQKPKTSRRKPSAASAVAGLQISAWKNDPFSQRVPTDPPNFASPIARPVPKLSSTGPLPIVIVAPATAPPAQQYSPGTPEFRYWTAAEALRRGGDLWGRLLPGVRWFKTVGPRLPVKLDAGIDLNAFYDRRGLEFFHDTVRGITVFSGESPDVVCHELGHAVLDAIRPPLFNAGFIETGAFHESFGDISGLLAALQLDVVRQDVLSETSGRLSRASSLSRMAEQLGWAIRQVAPGAAERDCLRNAANRFFYRDPSTLPPDAPATSLSSEEHSFSRVFTGAFLDALAGMLSAAAGGALPTEVQLLQVSENAARALIAAIRSAAVVPQYLSQVAAAMVNASSAKDRAPVSSAFVRHGILSLQAAMSAANVARVAAVPAARTPKSDELPTLAVSCAEYGLDADSILVCATSEPRRFEARAATLGAVAAVEAHSPSDDQAAKDFLEDLLQLGRVDFGKVRGGVAAAAEEHPLAHPERRKTHHLVREGKALRLQRLRFNCGFDCPSCRVYPRPEEAKA